MKKEIFVVGAIIIRDGKFFAVKEEKDVL